MMRRDTLEGLAERVAALEGWRDEMRTEEWATLRMGPLSAQYRINPEVRSLCLPLDTGGFVRFRRTPWDHRLLVFDGFESPGLPEDLAEQRRDRHYREALESAATMLKKDGDRTGGDARTAAFYMAADAVRAHKVTLDEEPRK